MGSSKVPSYQIGSWATPIGPRTEQTYQYIPFEDEVSEQDYRKHFEHHRFPSRYSIAFGWKLWLFEDWWWISVWWFDEDLGHSSSVWCSCSFATGFWWIFHSLAQETRSSSPFLHYQPWWKVAEMLGNMAWKFLMKFKVDWLVGWLVLVCCLLFVRAKTVHKYMTGRRSLGKTGEFTVVNICKYQIITRPSTWSPEISEAVLSLSRIKRHTNRVEGVAIAIASDVAIAKCIPGNRLIRLRQPCRKRLTCRFWA